MVITNDDIGKRVWGFLDGWGTIKGVVSNRKGGLKEVEVIFVKSDSSAYFNTDGRAWADELNPTLFWDEFKYIEPPKPITKQMVTKYLVLHPNRYQSVCHDEESAKNECEKNEGAWYVELHGEYEPRFPAIEPRSKTYTRKKYVSKKCPQEK